MQQSPGMDMHGPARPPASCITAGCLGPCRLSCWAVNHHPLHYLSSAPLYFFATPTSSKTAVQSEYHLRGTIAPQHNGSWVSDQEAGPRIPEPCSLVQGTHSSSPGRGLMCSCRLQPLLGGGFAGTGLSLSSRLVRIEGLICCFQESSVFAHELPSG